MDGEPMSELSRNAAASLIVCWRLMSERETVGRRRLFDAVNTLWALKSLQQSIGRLDVAALCDELGVLQ